MKRILAIVLVGLPICGTFALLWRSVASLRTERSIASNQQGDSDRRSGPYKYLPQGATIENEAKSVAFADLDADGIQEEIIFYSLPASHSAGVLVLKKQHETFIRFWEKIYADSLGFAHPSGVYDLNRSGKPQLFLHRTIGASCWGILDVFEMRQGRMERVTGAWANNGACQAAEIADLNHDGNSELIIRTRENGASTDIYAWSGTKYVRRNEQFADYYGNELADLIQNINSPMKLPVSARLTWSKQAAQIYLLQRRYAEGIQLLQAVLIMIDNPELTKSNSTLAEDASSDQQERLSSWFKIEKLEAKAAIHRLLGDTYRAAKDQTHAQQAYDEAETFKSEAETNKAKIHS